MRGRDRAARARGAGKLAAADRLTAGAVEGLGLEPLAVTAARLEQARHLRRDGLGLMAGRPRAGRRQAFRVSDAVARPLDWGL